MQEFSPAFLCKCINLMLVTSTIINDLVYRIFFLTKSHCYWIKLSIYLRVILQFVWIKILSFGLQSLLFILLSFEFRDYIFSQISYLWLFSIPLQIQSRLDSTPTFCHRELIVVASKCQN